MNALHILFSIFMRDSVQFVLLLLLLPLFFSSVKEQESIKSSMNTNNREMNTNIKNGKCLKQDDIFINNIVKNDMKCVFYMK